MRDWQWCCWRADFKSSLGKLHDIRGYQVETCTQKSKAEAASIAAENMLHHDDLPFLGEEVREHGRAVNMPDLTLD